MQSPEAELITAVNRMSYTSCNLVIPACPVTSGDSPRRESSFLKDSRQAGVTDFGGYFLCRNQ